MDATTTLSLNVTTLTGAAKITVTEAFKASLFGSALFFLGLSVSIVLLVVAKLLDDLLFGSPDGLLLKYMSPEYSTSADSGGYFTAGPAVERTHPQGRKKSSSTAAANPPRKSFQIGAMKF